MGEERGGDGVENGSADKREEEEESDSQQGKNFILKIKPALSARLLICHLVCVCVCVCVR